MRRLLVLAIAILFIASAVPAFAGGGACSSKDKGKVCGFVLPFQRIADTMTVGKAKPKNQLRPILQKVDTFQKASEDINETASEIRGSIK